MVVGRHPYFAPLLRRMPDEEFGELRIDGHDGGDHGLWRGKEDRRPRFAAQTEAKGKSDRPGIDDGLALVVHEDRKVVPGRVAQQAFDFVVAVQHGIDEPLLDRAWPGLRY